VPAASPVARCAGRPERPGGLFLGQAAEQTALGDPGETLVDRAHRGERRVEGEEGLGLLEDGDPLGIGLQVESAAAALLRPALPGVVDDDAPHRARGDGKEVGAPLICRRAIRRKSS